MEKVFPDSNILLDHSSELFSTYNQPEQVRICGYVLNEINKIKDKSPDETRKFKARRAARDIELAQEQGIVKYEIREGSFSLPHSFDPTDPDNKIISALKDLSVGGKEIVALSNDLLFREKCKSLGLQNKKFGKEHNFDNIYEGYKEVTLDEYEMSLHYQCPTNKFGLLNNQYLIIKDGSGEVVDRQRWTDDKGFVPLNTRPLKSLYFGDIKPKPKDEYQKMAIDSLNNSDFTLLYGISGSAKTLLSLAWIMQSIQNTKINKCVIVYNSVPLKNSKQQGYYPWDRTQKLLQSSLGGILSSKFGDMTTVESLITGGKLLLIPTSEIRGVEVSENDCIFVTEAQNTDIYTMKTIIQRAKGKLIVEGDMLEQQDLVNTNPYDNGMLRAIEIFKGSKYFSCVQLKNRYRHPMGDLADKM